MRSYYQDDLVVIYHADCRELLSSVEADVLVTDPPYGIALENHGRRDGRRANRDWTILNDGDGEVGQAVADWAADQALPTVMFATPMRPWRGEWRQFLVWDKGEHVAGGGDVATCWKPTWELIQVARTGPLNGRRDSAVIHINAVAADYALHPAPKPVALMKYLLVKIGGGTVLDPFMGSGSTLVAAKSLNRRAIGIELEERWCESAARRCSQGVLGLGAS
ncbi:MAG: DNA methyltransferase [Candidatus Limnocylindrales bacterium]